MENLKQIAKQFKLKGQPQEIKPMGTGLINDTFLIKMEDPNQTQYVLQRINHAIFKDVEMLQTNIERITNHVRYKLKLRGEKEIERKALQTIHTIDDKLYYYDGESYWRVTELIKNSKTYEAVTPEFAYYTGKAFGDFQSMLVDLPGEPLGATIPNFHNMEFRLEQFKEVIAKDPVGRLAKAQWMVDELLSRSEEMCKAERLHREGVLPKRVTHCDTKVNNMLFDENGEVLCVIDLDTTMPGYVLSDFGDFIRTAGNTGAEDDENLDNINLNFEVFKSFSRGYIEGTASFLTPIEKENLPYGAKLLTYMQTIRFLGDYIDGDNYYKIKNAEHNWQRSLAQFKLLRCIEEREQEMCDYIAAL